MLSKFNANINSKLILRCIKYVNIINLNFNKMEKKLSPSHNTFNLNNVNFLHMVPHSRTMFKHNIYMPICTW